MFVKVKEVMKSIVSRSTFLQQFYWLAESSKENVEIEIISTLLKGEFGDLMQSFRKENCVSEPFLTKHGTLWNIHIYLRAYIM